MSIRPLLRPALVPAGIALLGAAAQAQSSIHWDFDNVVSGTKLVPQSSAAVGLSGTVDSTATGTGAGVTPTGVYSAAFLSSTVFPYVRLTTDAPLSLDSILDAPGYGYAGPIDLDSRIPADEWVPASLL